LEGVIRFKERFGTERKEFSIYRRLTPIGNGYRIYRRLKQRFLGGNAL
jgi:hypothetical protein